MSLCQSQSQRCRWVQGFRLYKNMLFLLFMSCQGNIFWPDISTYINVHIYICFYHGIHDARNHITTFWGSRPFCGSRRIPPPEFGSFGPEKNGTQSRQDHCSQGREQREVVVFWSNDISEWNQFRYELSNIEIITWSGFLLKHRTWCGCRSKFGDSPTKVGCKRFLIRVQTNHWRL